MFAAITMLFLAAGSTHGTVAVAPPALENIYYAQIDGMT